MWLLFWLWKVVEGGLIGFFCSSPSTGLNHSVTEGSHLHPDLDAYLRWPSAMALTTCHSQEGQCCLPIKFFLQWTTLRKAPPCVIKLPGLIIETTNPSCQSCILTSNPLVARANVFRKIKWLHRVQWHNCSYCQISIQKPGFHPSKLCHVLNFNFL